MLGSIALHQLGITNEFCEIVRLESLNAEFVYAAAGSAPGLPAPTPPSRSMAIHQPGNARGSANGLSADVRAKIASCKANMLIDTFAMIEVKGQMRKTHVLLCSKPGETTTQKITTLTNAIAQVKANGQLPATEKARIVTQMQAKLSELAKRN